MKIKTKETNKLLCLCCPLALDFFLPFWQPMKTSKIFYKHICSTNLKNKSDLLLSIDDTANMELQIECLNSIVYICAPWTRENCYEFEYACYDGERVFQCKSYLKIYKLRSDVNSIHTLYSWRRVFKIIVLIQLFVNLFKSWNNKSAVPCCVFVYISAICKHGKKITKCFVLCKNIWHVVAHSLGPNWFYVFLL